MEETVAQKLKRLCDARAAEIRQAQKEGRVVVPSYYNESEPMDSGPTLEEILEDPTIVFNGQLPTEEEVARGLKRYAHR